MTQITLDKLKKLRESLPHGSVTKISKQTGYNRTYVSLVLHGKFFNLKIIAKAIELKKEFAKIKQSL